MTTFNLKLVHNCSILSLQLHEDITASPVQCERDHVYNVPTYPALGMLGGSCVVGFIIIRLILTLLPCHLKVHMKKSIKRSH